MGRKWRGKTAGKEQQRSDRKERPFRIEPLEPRLLLSAEFGILLPDADDIVLSPAPVVESVDRFDDTADIPAGDGLGEDDAATPLPPDSETVIDDPAQAETTHGNSPERATAAEEKAAAGEGEDPVAAEADETEAPGISAEALFDDSTESAIFLPHDAVAQSYMNDDLRQVVIVDAAVTDYTLLLETLIGSRKDVPVIDAAADFSLPEADPGGSATGVSAGSVESAADTVSPILSASSRNISSVPEPVFDVYLLDSGRDGIEQITSILDNYNDLDAVHIFSHGSMGLLRLGSTLTTSEELLNRRPEIVAWGQRLTSRGDLLLYGCNVAAGEAGTAFVEKLASITGADVAASSDRTGPVDRGGNWVLEFQTGPVEAPFVFSTIPDYSYSLETFTSTPDDETFEGTSGDDYYVFYDGWGRDTIHNPAGGRDTLDFSGVAADIVFTIHIDGGVSVTDGENVLNPVVDIDVIIGGPGDNRFVFEDGAVFAGEINAGANGTNTLDYSAWTTPVTVNLAEGTATGIGSISEISNIIGGSGHDWLTGDANNNFIAGGPGDDIINGGSGDNVLSAGEGNDTIRFSDGWGRATVTDIDSGSVFLDFSEISGDIVFHFSADGTVSAGDGENHLNAADGIDGIMAGTGDNRFVFERGAGFAGTIDASAGAANTLDFSGLKRIVDPGHEGAPDRTGLDLDVTISAAGAVSVAADGSAILTAVNHMHHIIGGAGDNHFTFADMAVFDGTIDGGEGGFNTLDYSACATGVTVSLGVGTDDGVATGTSGIIHFQKIIGSQGDDVLSGNAHDNIIDGGPGNDMIDGGSGVNILTGGTGDDTFRFSDDWGEATITDAGAGFTTLDFSDVTADLVVAFHDDGTLSVEDFTSRLNPLSGADRIRGGWGDDTFVFENTAAFEGEIDGGEGENTLDFSAWKTPLFAGRSPLTAAR